MNTKITKNIMILIYVSLFLIVSCQKKQVFLPAPQSGSDSTALLDESNNHSLKDDFSDIKKFEKKDESCKKEEAIKIPNPQEPIKLQGGDSGCKTH